jgi:hypothetical protein
MKRLIGVFLFVAVCAVTANSQAASKRPQIFDIRQPTIVALFMLMTEAEANSGEGDAEALDDFNYYAYKVEKPLRNAGIEFHVAEKRSFQIRMGAKLRTFQTGKDGVGYYFIAPGKEPHIEYGVMTDEDLLVVARKYFDIAIPQAGPRE